MNFIVWATLFYQLHSKDSIEWLSIRLSMQFGHDMPQAASWCLRSTCGCGPRCLIAGMRRRWWLGREARRVKSLDHVLFCSEAGRTSTLKLWRMEFWKTRQRWNSQKKDHRKKRAAALVKITNARWTLSLARSRSSSPCTDCRKGWRQVPKWSHCFLSFKKPWRSMKIHEDPWRSVKIREDPWRSVKIHEVWTAMKCYELLWTAMNCSELLWTAINCSPFWGSNLRASLEACNLRLERLYVDFDCLDDGAAEGATNFASRQVPPIRRCGMFDALRYVKYVSK